MTEDRGQKTEDRGQNTEDGGLNTEDGKIISENGSRKTENRSQNTDLRLLFLIADYWLLVFFGIDGNYIILNQPVGGQVLNFEF